MTRVVVERAFDKRTNEALDLHESVWFICHQTTSLPRQWLRRLGLDLMFLSRSNRIGFFGAQ